MSDSLVIANSIELLQGDEGGQLSTLPMLGGTTFALNDQQTAYDLGTPQPTVDILASLITDGERPQGRRASNRTLNLPVAIISDSRDNLALARETLFQLVDAQESERFTITYTRDSESAALTGIPNGPLILDCWRAMPTSIQYSQPEENQYVCELVLQFEALPYGHSDTPNTITFLNPTGSTQAPPSPITLDPFNIIPTGMQGTWVESTAAVQGGSCAFCPSPSANPQITNPYYINNSIGTNDLTVGTGVAGMVPNGSLAQLNVIQFWAGFASQSYFNNWLNHESEVRFIVTLTDVNGNTVAASRQYRMSESNSYKTPKWHNIQVRIPTQQSAVFDWTQVTGFSIKVQNFGDALFHNSNVFLDTCNAIAPSASAANLTRGSIYKLNGVEGSVHTAASFVIQQQPSINPTTTTLSANQAPQSFQGPAGVTAAIVEAIGNGGNGGQITTPTAYAGGGGSGEYSRENSAQFTPGKVYPAYIPKGLPNQVLGAFSAFTQVAQFNSPGPNISNPSSSFVASSVAAGSTIIFTVVAPSGSSSLSTWVFDDNSANAGTYLMVGSSVAPDGTQTAVFVQFNTVALTNANTYTVTGLTCPTSVEIVGHSATGLFQYIPSLGNSSSGTSNLPYIDMLGFLNGSYSANQIASGAIALSSTWSATGTNASLSLNSSPPAGSPVAKTIDLVTTSSAAQPHITTTQLHTYTPVVGGQVYMARILCEMATQTDLHIWCNMNFYDATKTYISTTSDEVLKTAGTWEWNVSAEHTAPSNAAYVLYDFFLNSSTANNVLHIAELGVVQAQTSFPIEFVVFANNSDLSATTTTNGWSHLYSSAAENPLSNDIFTNANIGNCFGGDLCAGQGYSSSVPWGAVSVMFARAGQTTFTADNVEIVANGGSGVPAGNSNGGALGCGSLNSTHNYGAYGANGVATNGGGGASSGGSGGVAAFTDDTNASCVFSTGHMAPPQLISSGIPQPGGYKSSASGNKFTYGANITQTGAVSGDTVVVAVLSDTTARPSVFPTDTHNNPYTWIGNAFLTDGRQLALFYIAQSTFTTLNVGDQVWVGDTAKGSSTPGDYAVFVYVMYNVIGLGAAQGAFDQTSATPGCTLTGMGTGSHGTTIFTHNETNQIATLTSSLQDTSADAEDFSGVKGHTGSNWTNQGQHLDLSWIDSTTSSQTFNFALGSSAELSMFPVEWNLSTVGGWTAVTGASTAFYTNGTHHYSHFAGQKLVISFTGAQAQVVGIQAPNHGIMLVSVDGGPYVEVDTYATAYRYKAVLFDTGPMANTSHTITILTAAIKNSASTDSYIDIDGYQIVSTGAGIQASGVTGAAAVTGGGAGGNGGATSANGSAGATPGGGGGGASSTSGVHTGGAGGDGKIILTYYSSQPAFKTCILHRPSLDGSKTLLPYIACVTQAVPTNDQVQPIDVGTVPQFKGTYSMMIAAAAFNTPSASRTITVTVNEYERLGGAVTSTQSTSRVLTPNNDAINNIVTIGELTLPNKDIPDENSNAVYFVAVNSTNASDTIQDVMMLDTMGQTVFINESTGYAQYFIDEPFPDRDIGRVLGSQYDRPYAISVLDAAFPTGGPISLEPGDNILFAYCYEGAPALAATYFPRYYIDRTMS